MKMRKYIVALLMVAMLVTMSPLAVFANDNKLTKNSYVSDDSVGDWIQWNLDTEFTLYTGQKLFVDFNMWDTYKYVYTVPAFEIYPEGESNYVYKWWPQDSYSLPPVDSWRNYNGVHDIDSKHLEEGEYYIGLSAMPCYKSGIWVSDYYTYGIPTEYIWFTIKDLPKPTTFTAKAGKKSATLNWNKVPAAEKYQVYRSTKKSSGYKKIATVTACTYKNKSLKKGKTYYYKVRAVLGSSDSSIGVAYSSYTSAKKVKVK